MWLPIWTKKPPQTSPVFSHSSSTHTVKLVYLINDTVENSVRLVSRKECHNWQYMLCVACVPPSVIG